MVYRFYSSRLEIGNVRDAGLSDEKTQGRGNCNEQSYKSNSLPHVVSLITPPVQEFPELDVTR